MNKLTSLLAFAATLSLAAPAFAADANDVVNDAQSVQSDQGAVAKDNTAIAKQHATMEKNRAEKAKAKASGDLATQASTSIKLGANHVAVGEKDAEKSVDQNILAHDKNTMKDDATSAAQ